MPAGFPEVPGHPGLRGLGDLIGVVLRLGEVVEGIGTAELAGVDQAHEEIPDSPWASK